MTALCRVAGALAILILLAGCDPASRETGVLGFGLAAPPRILDPRFATDAVSARVNRLLYRRLVELDAQGRPVPGLASWERLSPTHYRFRLGKEGRTFADGSRLTARDVTATYGFVMDPANGSPHRSQLGLVAAIEIADSDRLDVRLTAPDPLFPAYLALGILPAKIVAEGRPIGRRPLGSGPFRLVDWPEPGRLRLQRRSDGQLVEFVVVKDPSVRVMKLLRGEIQMLQNDLSPELVDYLSRRDSVRVETRPGRNFSYLGFNLEDPIAGDPVLRRALAHALDRESLLEYLFRGRGRKAEAIFPPDHWAGHPDLKPFAYDPGLARSLLEGAGFGPDRPLRLTIKTSSDPFRIRLATAIQAQFAAVGIELSIRSYDWGTFFGDVKAGRFQLYGLTWVGVHTPDIFRYAFHSQSVPPQGANRGRFRHPEADRLIEAAGREPDLDRQARLYRALQALIHAELPYLPLWYEAQVVATRTQVEGYRLAADGNYDGLEQARLVGH